MSKLTVLEMTQKILSAMDSDEVNSITDTMEAEQVVDIIQDTYVEMMSNTEWNHLKNPKQLESLSDEDYPTTLKIPETVISLETLRYDVSEAGATKISYSTMKYMSPEEFTDAMLKLDSSAANTETLTVKGTSSMLIITNDKAPQYWTSFDEEYIVLDSYDEDVDDTLRGNKSMVYCVEIPVFTKDDDFVPVCPVHMFPTLLAEAKRAAFFYLKETASPIDEKRSLAGRNRLKRKDHRAHERVSTRTFGRR